MLIVTASLQSDPQSIIQQWLDLCVDEHSRIVRLNYAENIGTVPSFQWIWEHTGYPSIPIICYLHDDVTIHERGWDRRIAREFEDPRVAIVGMGGALGIGTPDLYRKPYRIEQLIRRGYRSNQTDWQTHGAQEKEACNVAVVDGFCMAVRRSFLDQIHGWKWFPYTFHCYDVALCLMARRHGWKVRMVGVNVTHHGGGASTSPEYKAWCEARGTTMEREHWEPHVWMYREFKDVLPFEVSE